MMFLHGGIGVKTSRRGSLSEPTVEQCLSRSKGSAFASIDHMPSFA
ncbi:hypothetical protein AWB78_05931 [Caballeronia calidae]|uniref:Uncharacterized protein n=1 Tax=Caballeronia calidae TaxID=1777139 RepID=A0A158E1L2_9BURK|nr:hypothetical protein AWB78_05931 [Caballeronia calidae]